MANTKSEKYDFDLFHPRCRVLSLGVRTSLCGIVRVCMHDYSDAFMLNGVNIFMIV